jgi:hypothetical protein
MNFLNRKWLALVIPLLVASCTPQLNATEKLSECTQLTEFANNSIDPTVFGTDSKSFNQAADKLELNARSIKEAKFRDVGIKNTAEKLILLNKETAEAARELGKTVDKLNQKTGDFDLTNQLKEQSNKLTELGDKVTTIVKPQLDQCPSRKNI